MYLFFDTETTGLPRNWKASVSDVNNWPRMVQLAWLLFDADGNKMAGKDYIVKPEGYLIPKEVSKIHGISQEKAMLEGLPLIFILNDFMEQIHKSRYLVAHNINFDEMIVGAEFLRNGLLNAIPSKAKICTMQKSTDYCKIPGQYGFKWPKLTELHRALFHDDFEEAHNAAADINATARCFWELRKRRVL